MNFDLQPTLAGTLVELRPLKREDYDALLAAAPDPQAAQVIAFNIWSLWFRAPTEEARQLMDDAMERRRAYDFAGSIAILDKLASRLCANGIMLRAPWSRAGAPVRAEARW